MKFEPISECIIDKISGEWGTESSVSSGTRVIRTANFSNDGKINFADIIFRNIEKHKIDKKKLHPGDVIIEKSGGSPVQPVGRVVYFENPDNQIYLCNNFTSILRPDPRKVFPKFFFYALFFNHKKGKTLKYQNKTTGIINLKLDNYLKTTIPVPQFDDQIRIATLLSRIETMIATRKDNLRLLDEFLKSTFLEMFGPTNPDFNSWPLTEIKELAADHKGAMRTGPFGSNLLHNEFTESGDVAVLGIDNAVQNKFAWGKKRFITKEKYENLKSYRIFPRDVIITIMGTIGRSAVVPDDIPLAINTKHLAAITLDNKKANPKFISYTIHSSPYIIHQFDSKTRGAIMSGLNLGIIKETKLRRPPVDLQNQFAIITDKVESLKTLYQNCLNELENLYGALSQKAFKGELDLSRIPLEKEHEEEVSDVTQEVVDQVPKLDSYAISDPAAREKLLRQLFDAFIAERKGASFSLDDFWTQAEQKVLDHMDDESHPLGVGDYDKAKEWLFELIKSGNIRQLFYEENNYMGLSIKR